MRLGVVFIGATLAVLSCASSARSATSPPQSDSVAAQVGAILSRSAAHGVSFDDAASLPEAALPHLLRALKDPDQKLRWPTALTVVGIMGGTRAEKIIHEFIWGRFDGEQDVSTFRAIMTAVDALGWSKSGPTREGLQELVAGTDPEYWRQLPWTHTIAGSGSHARVILSQVAINGLSYTGTQEAESTLAGLRLRPHHRKQVANIEEGIVRNRAVKVKGLRSYWMEANPK